MGIHGLLEILSPFFIQKKLSDFSGKTIGIDGYTWLYSALHNLKYSKNNSLMSQELITAKIINFFKEKIYFMQLINVTPYFVFDGADLPVKENTNSSRKATKLKKSELFKEYLLNKNYKEANYTLLYSLDVSPLLAKKVIDFLKKQNVKFIVAPYEADCQLAYLYKIKHIDMVITIDSDLILYSVNEILYMSATNINYYGKYICINNVICNELIIYDNNNLSVKTNSDLIIIDNKHISNNSLLNTQQTLKSTKSIKYNSHTNNTENSSTNSDNSNSNLKIKKKLEKSSNLLINKFDKFDYNMLILMCIISGCDYSKKIKGVGINTAYSAIIKNIDLKIQLDKELINNNVTFYEYICKLIDLFLTTLKDKKKIIIPNDTKNEIITSYFTFKCQTVYCPLSNKLIPLNDYKDIRNFKFLNDIAVELENFDFLGLLYNDSLAIEVAYGNINPNNKKQYIENSFNNRSLNLISMYRDAIEDKINNENKRIVSRLKKSNSKLSTISSQNCINSELSTNISNTLIASSNKSNKKNKKYNVIEKFFNLDKLNNKNITTNVNNEDKKKSLRNFELKDNITNESNDKYNKISKKLKNNKIINDNNNLSLTNNNIRKSNTFKNEIKNNKNYLSLDSFVYSKKQKQESLSKNMIRDNCNDNNIILSKFSSNINSNLTNEDSNNKINFNNYCFNTKIKLSGLKSKSVLNISNVNNDLSLFEKNIKKLKLFSNIENKTDY